MSVPVVEDTSIYPLLTRLTDCLCSEMESSGLAVTCRCLLVPGVGPTLDFCDAGCDGSCPGEAWVRLMRAFPSTNFPGQDAQGTCAAPLGFEIEVGVSRCLPVGDSRGNPPDDQAIFEVARLQLADMAAMRRAIMCCFAKVDTEYVLGNFEPTFASGGCLVSTWGLLVRQEF
jgi:hypothetical protein